MRRNLVKAGQRFVAVLLLALGPSFYGCKDTVSISDDVAVPLSSLTVTPVHFNRRFSAIRRTIKSMRRILPPA